MQKLGAGYTSYFNIKNKRTGVLFQGAFKAVHIDSNEQLLYVSSYVNLNFKVHQLGGEASKLKLMKSSWDEYVGENNIKNNEAFCEKDIILDQFKNKNEYKKHAFETLELVLENKKRKKEDETEEEKGGVQELFLE